MHFGGGGGGGGGGGWETYFGIKIWFGSSRTVIILVVGKGIELPFLCQC